MPGEIVEQKISDETMAVPQRSDIPGIYFPDLTSVEVAGARHDLSYYQYAGQRLEFVLRSNRDSSDYSDAEWKAILFDELDKPSAPEFFMDLASNMMSDTLRRVIPLIHDKGTSRYAEAGVENILSSVSRIAPALILSFREIGRDDKAKALKDSLSSLESPSLADLSWLKDANDYSQPIALDYLNRVVSNDKFVKDYYTRQLKGLLNGTPGHLRNIIEGYHTTASSWQIPTLLLCEYALRLYKIDYETGSLAQAS